MTRWGMIPHEFERPAEALSWLQGQSAVAPLAFSTFYFVVQKERPGADLALRGRHFCNRGPASEWPP